MFIREKREFEDGLKFFNLNNGCQHSISEWMMANGKFERPPMCIMPCGDKCSVCRGEWSEIYLPVYEDSVVDFLCSGVASEHFPKQVDYKSKVSDMLWENPYWVKKIFDEVIKTTVKRTNVDAFFLSLRAAGILVIEKRGGGIRWNIARDMLAGAGNLGAPKCARDWSMFLGVHLHPPKRRRKNDPDPDKTIQPITNFFSRVNK